MGYNESKAFERFQKQLIERLTKVYGEKIFEPKVEPEPVSLIDLFHMGQLGFGPHQPGYGGPARLKRLQCLGCGCCRMMPKHLYCEQCLVGRRPWTRRR